MKKLLSILLYIFLIAGWAGPVSAEVKFDFAIGGGFLSGHTTYQIGGRVDDASGSEYVHFPLSELEFPLDVYIGSVEGSIEFARKWEVGINVETSISSDAGDMKDSDWLAPGSLDIYSESDADLDALIWDANLRYTFYEGFHGEMSCNRRSGMNPNIRWSYFVGVGYIYQNFDYDMKDLHQWYPSSPSTPHDYISGKVLTYEVTYEIPYAEIGMEFNYRDKFCVELSVGGSPIVHVEDEDHHILRSNVYKADYDWDGEALLFSLDTRYNFLRHWFLALTFDYSTIDGEGRSKAYSGGVYDHSIDQEIESEQTSGSLIVGCAF